jgi:hypothetical protein
LGDISDARNQQHVPVGIIQESQNEGFEQARIPEVEVKLTMNELIIDVMVSLHPCKAAMLERSWTLNSLASEVGWI